MTAQIHIQKKGFTLIETVIAIGIVAVLLTGFMTVFAPAQSSLRQSMNAQEARRLADAVEIELSTIRSHELTAEVTSAFDKAFELVLETPAIGKGRGQGKLTQGQGLIAYQYKAIPSSDPTSLDKKLLPYVSQGEGEDSGVVGEDYILVSSVRSRSDATEIRSELEALQGRVYYVRLVPINAKRDDGHEVNRSAAASIKNSTGTAVTSAENFEEAVLNVTMEFYALPTGVSQYVLNTYKGPTDRQKPAFTRTLGIRR